jgi:hypothetical protein
MLAIPIPREDHIKLTLGFGLKVGCKTKRKHDKLITAPGGSLQSQLIDVLVDWAPGTLNALPQM